MVATAVVLWDLVSSEIKHLSILSQCYNGLNSACLGCSSGITVQMANRKSYICLHKTACLLPQATRLPMQRLDGMAVSHAHTARCMQHAAGMRTASGGLTLLELLGLELKAPREKELLLRKEALPGSSSMPSAAACCASCHA